MLSPGLELPRGMHVTEPFLALFTITSPCLSRVLGHSSILTVNSNISSYSSRMPHTKADHDSDYASDDEETPRRTRFFVFWEIRDDPSESINSFCARHKDDPAIPRYDRIPDHITAEKWLREREQNIRENRDPDRTPGSSEIKHRNFIKKTQEALGRPSLPDGGIPLLLYPSTISGPGDFRDSFVTAREA